MTLRSTVDGASSVQVPLPLSATAAGFAIEDGKI
jgi:hypothetical protein